MKNFPRLRSAFVTLVLCVTCVVGTSASARAEGAEIGPTVEGFSCVMGMGSGRSATQRPINGAFQWAYKCFINSTATNTTPTVNSVITAVAAFPATGSLTGFNINTQSISNSGWFVHGTCPNNGTTTYALSHGQMRLNNGTTTGTPTSGTSLPDNYFELTISCTLTAGDPGGGWQYAQPNFTFTRYSTGEQLRFNTMSCRRAPSTSGQPCSSGGGYGPYPAYGDITGSGAAAWAAAVPDHFLVNGGFPADPACEELDLSFRYRPAGVGEDWVDVGAFFGDIEHLDFGDTVEWTLELPTLSETYSVDHLAFILQGPTPLTYTGASPIYLTRRLAPYHFDPYDEDYEHYWDEMLTGVGIGVQWPIRPGWAMSQEQSPTTLTGRFLWMGESTDQPALAVQCRIYGDSELDSIMVNDAEDDPTYCDLWTVERRSDQDDNDSWSFYLNKHIPFPQSASVGGVLAETSVQWRNAPPGSTPGSWSDVGEDSAGWFEIPKADVSHPEAVQFRCQSELLDGTPVENEMEPVNGTAIGGDSNSAAAAGCFDFDDMSLTNPISWVTGIGDMLTCLVGWAFIPRGTELGESFDAFKTELEGQFPFSIGFVIIGFAETLGNELESASGTGCFDMGGEWSLGSAGDVNIDDVCIGDGLNVSGHRALLATMFVTPMIWMVCQHAYKLIAKP